MKIQKSFSIIIAGAMLTFSLAACGSNSNSAVDNSESVAVQPKSLK